MRKFIKIFFAVIVLAFIGIQFVKVEKTNPPVTGDINVNSNLKNVFKNACYDCHSNETKWPWYSNIAPVSWLVADDVKEGRKHLNFSEWEKYNDTRKSRKREEIWEQVNEGEMPMKIYTYLHPSANLDVVHKNLIKEWATKKNPWE